MTKKMLKNTTIEIQDLGIIDYKKAYEYQNELFSLNLELKKQNKSTFNTLLLCEHPHVYTLGKHGKKENLLISENLLHKLNAYFVKTDRGGDITYHGFGQLVVYPIFDLDNFSIGTKQFVEKLENLIIKLLKIYKINGTILDDAPGVWIKNDKNIEKICAIGLKVSNHITMHGIALNVNTDLNYFSFINACGFKDRGTTSMQKILHKKIDFQKVKEQIKELFLSEFKTS